MIVGMVAFVLILCNGIILGRPGDSVEIGLGIGYFVGLLALGRDARRRATCARRVYGDARKPPGRHLMAWLSRRWTRPTAAPARTATSRWSSCARPSTRALAGARWIGRGEKEAADGAAVDAMRLMLDTVSMDGVVVIGEGEKDEAPMLYNGEHIGDGSPPEVDIAVDPLEGTELCAKGLPNALAVIALAERGTMFDPGPCVYMVKMATSRRPRAPARPRPPARRDAQADRQARRASASATSS